jgi:hypothetical protein
MVSSSRFNHRWKYLNYLFYIHLFTSKKKFVGGKKTVASTYDRIHGQILRLFALNETLFSILLGFVLHSYLSKTPHKLLDKIGANIFMPSTLA